MGKIFFHKDNLQLYDNVLSLFVLVFFYLTDPILLHVWTRVRFFFIAFWELSEEWGMSIQKDRVDQIENCKTDEAWWTHEKKGDAWWTSDGWRALKIDRPKPSSLVNFAKLSDFIVIYLYDILSYVFVFDICSMLLVFLDYLLLNSIRDRSSIESIIMITI